ncbi:hypothetical protein LEP1GSC013_4461 [Leptospira interrogans serovar Valbuzzi str. Duyster]|nr:hypothetical protein LEP1GSC013_4461 [Leptospira interrogans serovar Valbuzzi str. Duyster]ENO73541.1 hypothetical protein LEP1GSC012_1758 [Leptospira interrogans serovar Valbuzzi str. Valbuzzi]
MIRLKTHLSKFDFLNILAPFNFTSSRIYSKIPFRNPPSYIKNIIFLESVFILSEYQLN